MRSRAENLGSQARLMKLPIFSNKRDEAGVYILMKTN